MAEARRPDRLEPGDVVGVVAPAGVVDEVLLEAGIAAVRRLGLDVRCGTAVRARAGYLAGPDDARLADLQHMLDAPSVKAVFCARGGYGCQRLVPRLDLSGIRAHPKLVMGYSDVTALLTTIVRTGIVAVHGPMVAADFARGLSDAASDHLRRLLVDPEYRWEVPTPAPVRPGRARGRLVGGCLSVLASTVGTPWALDAGGAILFLEDVHERSYRIDRLLLQLRQAGILDGVAGVVFGTFEECRPFDGVAPIDVVREHFRDAPYPVCFGVAAGHTRAGSAVEHWALPLGVEVELDTGSGRLRALEGAVC